MTLRDINRALDDLGVEAFIPHTARDWILFVNDMAAASPTRRNTAHRPLEVERVHPS